MKKHLKIQKGFTLTELIIVLAVLGLILAIAVPNYLEVQNASSLRADLITIGMIEKSENHYHAINQAHSFDETEEQTASNFQDSLDRLASLLDPVEFHVISNVHWAEENNHWYVSYDNTSSQDDDAADVEKELPDHPEWQPNTEYSQGERVIHNGYVFEALYATTLEPGILYNGWNEITDEWRSFNVYHGGDTVEYNGHTYRAKNWTRNDLPGSAAVWELIQ